MSAPKHTPGPWVATPSSATIRARRTFHGAVNDYIVDNSVIANLPASSDRYANARLIAASPTMFEYIKKKADAGDAEALEIMGAIRAKGGDA